MPIQPAAKAEPGVKSSLVLNAGTGSVQSFYNSSIILSAEDSNWSNSGVNGGFFVKPVNDAVGQWPLMYNTTSGEITYDSTVRRRLKPAAEARFVELERRNTALEAQVKALAEKVEALMA